MTERATANPSEIFPGSSTARLTYTERVREVSEHGRGFKLAELWPLLLVALVNLLVHAAVNHRYGFHRDELATVDDARFLAWGYVAYPPVTPFIARVAFTLFGTSLVGLRFFAALAMSACCVLAGLMARSLGGRRFAQLLAALAVAAAPLVIIEGSLFQYVSFDYLCWVALALMFINLLRSGDERWWPGIGAVIGLGMLTKYSIAFFVVGLVAGVLLTRARGHLKSGWLWAGVALALLIWLPNLLWQVEHDFISLKFLQSIHERDVRIGRAEGFLREQFFVCTNLVTVPLWLAGLWFYAVDKEGRKFRALLWMFVVPFILLLVARGRSYYLAPAYPMLLAAGSVFLERKIFSDSFRHRGAAVTASFALILAGCVVFGALLLPLAPVNSGLWKVSNSLQDNFREEIGWQELAETVAGVYRGLPTEEQAHAGVLAGNYGEAGAINLYGRRLGLPETVSGVNSYWLRGYAEPPPATLIVVGFSEARATRLFETCSRAARVTNRFGVENEETREHPDIFVCRGPRLPWKEFWSSIQSFG